MGILEISTLGSSLYPLLREIDRLKNEGVSHVVDTGGMPVLGESVHPAVNIITGDGVKLQLD